MKAFFLFLYFFFALSLWAKSETLRPITLQLQWKHQFEFAGFYAAKEQGYYEAVGLDVSFVEYESNSTVVGAVLDKGMDYGVGYSSVIAEYMNGKPIVLLANFFKHSPLALVTQKSIQTPADLKNKKIMGLSDNIDSITVVNMLSKFGVDRSDYENIPTDFKIDSFVSKEIDAMSLFTTNEIYDLNRLGIAFNVFNPSLYGQEYYDVNLFTSAKKLQNNPKEVKEFTKASIAGWKYALEHKEELCELILQKYNTQKKTKEALMFEALQIENLMLQNVYPIGSIDIQRVKMMANEFKQAGFINKDTKKDIENIVFVDLNEEQTVWNLEYYLKYASASMIWQIVAFLFVVLVLVVWRNYIGKRLNAELQEKMQNAIEETREKDKILFHQNKLASMGEMMQNIAHQWRQPLSQVNSAVLVIDDMLESRGIKDDMLEEKLLEIENLTNYMSKTISDFKEFYSKSKHKEKFILEDLIYEAIKIMQGRLKENGISLEFDEWKGKRYETFKSELMQVLVIILSNAIEAHHENKTKNAQIKIYLVEEMQYYLIEICDNAGGIDESILEKVFEPYFTTKHMSQGTGLGLYIAKLIIEESIMGELSVENIEDGACFKIKLGINNE